MTIHNVIPDDYQFATQKLDFLHSDNSFHCAALGNVSMDPMAEK